MRYLAEVEEAGSGWTGDVLKKEVQKAFKVIETKLPKKKRKKVVRKKQFKTIFITGARHTKNFSIPYIKKCLKMLVEDTWPNFDYTGYIITGSSRDIESDVISVAKAMKIKVLQAPANFQAFSGTSAEQVRNSDILLSFKPDAVAIFSHKDLEHDSVLENLQKMCIKRNIPLKVWH